MNHYYILDSNGNIHGSFDSKELAQQFANTLTVEYKILDRVEIEKTN